MKTIFSLLLLFALIIKCQYSFAEPENTDPIILKYGIFIKKIAPDFKNGTFYAEFYWWTTFSNDSLKSGKSNSDIMNLMYENGIETPLNAFSDETQEVRTLRKNTYYYTGYHQGSFFFNPDFRNYPFDKQELKIEIEHQLFLENELEIKPDFESYKFCKNSNQFLGISNKLLKSSSISFNIYKSMICTGVDNFNSNFGDPDFPSESKYSQLTYSVFISRAVAPYITKLFIPLAIILFLVYFVFFIPADKLDMAGALTVTSLLSAIAFQYTVNSSLPEIGYLVFVDKIFYLTYLLIVLSMAESLFTFYLDKSGEENKIKLAQSIDKTSRILFPILFILGSIILAS